MNKELPILFSTDMVLAKLDGRKTQTRRMSGLDEINKQPDRWEFVRMHNGYAKFTARHNATNEVYVKCPYGEAGYILYTRETWGREFGGGFLYKASHQHMTPDGKWKPSIHMPKTAARIWLEVTNVRVERLQDISEDDAKAEGVALHEKGKFWLDYVAKKYDTTQFVFCQYTARDSFKSLWDSLTDPNDVYAKRWRDNPWVWVIDFKVLSTTGKPDFLNELKDLFSKL